MLAASFQCTALHVHMRDWYCNPGAVLRNINCQLLLLHNCNSNHRPVQ